VNEDMNKDMTSAIQPFVDAVNANRPEDVGLAIFEFVFQMLGKMSELGIPPQESSDAVGEACAEAFGKLGVFMNIAFHSVGEEARP
jgi:hypothetical protein